jgi:hypothetical protein
LRRCAILRHWFKPDGERVGKLRDLQARAARPKGSGFKAYEPGYLHVDVKYLPQLADESSRRYLFVAIDRATRLGSSSASSRQGPRPMRGPRHRV